MAFVSSGYNPEKPMEGRISDIGPRKYDSFFPEVIKKNFGKWLYHEILEPGVLVHVAESGDKVYTCLLYTSRGVPRAGRAAAKAFPRPAAIPVPSNGSGGENRRRVPRTGARGTDCPAAAAPDPADHAGQGRSSGPTCLPRQADGHAAIRHVLLELPDRIFAVMHDGGDERRRSAAFRHGVHHCLLYTASREIRVRTLGAEIGHGYGTLKGTGRSENFMPDGTQMLLGQGA